VGARQIARADRDSIPLTVRSNVIAKLYRPSPGHPTSREGCQLDRDFVMSLRNVTETQDP